MTTEERMKKIEEFVYAINSSIEKTREEWNNLENGGIPEKKKLEVELRQIESVISSLGGIDLAVKRNDFYGRFLNLATKVAVPLSDETLGHLSIWKYITSTARNLVESMHKAEMFDGLGDDDLFKSLDSSVDRFCRLLFENPSELICEYFSKPWLEDKINIGLFGHYSSGKTTILNCLYDENFPVNAAENTAIPTYLYSGDSHSDLVLVDHNGQSIAIDLKDISILDNKQSEGFPFYRMYEYIAKQNPSVPQNLTIVDAPGLMGKNSEIPVVKAIKQCDIIVWLMKASESIGDEDIRFIKNNVDKPLFVVLTYTDRMNDSSYERTKDVISARFREEDISVQSYIRYNKKNEIEFRECFISNINNSIVEQNIAPQNPYKYIYAAISYIRRVLKANEKYYTECKNKYHSNAEKYENNINRDCGKLSNTINTLISKRNQLIDAYNDSTFAGKKIATKIDSLSEAIKVLIQAWNDFDLANISKYASSVEEKQGAIHKLALIEDLKKEFEESIGKLYKND